jgi:hypothetical protein
VVGERAGSGVLGAVASSASTRSSRFHLAVRSERIVDPT